MTFLFIGCVFDVDLRNFWQTQGYKDFLLNFPLAICFSFTFKSVVQFKLIFYIHCEIWIKVTFLMDPVSFVEKTSLSPLNCM